MLADPAFAHYTVDRETSEQEATPSAMRRNMRRKGWRAIKHRLTHRVPLVEKGPRVDADLTVVVKDVVRVRDRAAFVVFEEILDRREESEALHDQITSDLLDMDVEAFRAKYRIGRSDSAQG